ncbi:MAG: 4Fe-4S dicluster domain-containing protein [Candidatus Omnitrophica bacterium]|nr:4Fe-4S dicluster domain-containing protein [Candidatus Omnitrophota bacterium]
MPASGVLPKLGEQVIIAREGLQQLLELLKKQGHQLIGPTVRDGAIVYETITSETDLPVGVSDIQNAGSYQLGKRPDRAYFGFTVGPQSWKKFLFPPALKLFSANRNEEGFEVSNPRPETPNQKLAFIGVRSCELHALAIQDKIFLQGQYVDSYYKSVRDSLFIVAVNCGHAGGTCFCASMKTGPKATSGFDLSLTEITGVQSHYFVVEAGSEAGARILSQMPFKPAVPKEKKAAKQATQRALDEMGRVMETEGIKELLYRNYESPRWEKVAERCLSCANCTMVCPTCFCSTVEDVTDLTGDHAERWRKWDSCFTMDFSHIHGGNVRSSVKSRYRQWMTHKLATWVDQFGASGCVGCGRCITWCPVGIDITEEVKAIRQGEKP